jgi:hypothetical protein
MKKVVMTGCPRSGTTALCTLLSHHPDIFITNEMGNFSWGRDADFSERVKFSIDKEYIDWILKDKGIDKADFIEKVSPASEEYCETINREYGLEVVGDKLPGYITPLLDIYNENPEAYFIITLRGVRAFVSSSTNHHAAGVRAGWTFETIEEAQEFWVIQNSKLLENVGQMIPRGAKVILLRYEDIGHDIDQTLKRISNFLEFPVELTNPRGGFDPPFRPHRVFIPSVGAEFLMNILGY